MAAATLPSLFQHNAPEDIHHLRAAPAERQAAAYRELLGGLLPRPPLEGGTEVLTATLKARTELNSNHDIFKVTGILGLKPWRDHVRSFAFSGTSSDGQESWFLIKFGASKGDLPKLYRSVSCFFEALQALPDCHRICQTMKILDEYDGEWQDQARDKLDKIRQRLPDKLQAEL